MNLKISQEKGDIIHLEVIQALKNACEEESDSSKVSFTFEDDCYALDNHIKTHQNHMLYNGPINFELFDSITNQENQNQKVLVGNLFDPNLEFSNSDANDNCLFLQNEILHSFIFKHKFSVQTREPFEMIIGNNQVIYVGFDRPEEVNSLKIGTNRITTTAGVFGRFNLFEFYFNSVNSTLEYYVNYQKIDNLAGTDLTNSLPIFENSTAFGLNQEILIQIRSHGDKTQDMFKICHVMKVNHQIHDHRKASLAEDHHLIFQENRLLNENHYKIYTGYAAKTTSIFSSSSRPLVIEIPVDFTFLPDNLTGMFLQLKLSKQTETACSLIFIDDEDLIQPIERWEESMILSVDVTGNLTIVGQSTNYGPFKKIKKISLESDKTGYGTVTVSGYIGYNRTVSEFKLGQVYDPLDESLPKPVEFSAHNYWSYPQGLKSATRNGNFQNFGVLIFSEREGV